MINKLIEDLNTIKSLFDLHEAKAHNPFSGGYSHLGNKSPGGRSGADREDKWDCHKKGPYLQVCKGIGADNEGWTKIVKVDKSWKKAYNHEMKTGTASGKYTPAIRSGGKSLKKAKNKKKDD